MQQIKVGKVTAIKMDKTVLVRVAYKIKHKLYKKIITRSKNFKARDDIGVEKGQNVKIIGTRPYAKEVNFKILEVIK